MLMGINIRDSPGEELLGVIMWKLFLGSKLILLVISMGLFSQGNLKMKMSLTIFISREISVILEYSGSQGNN